MTRLYEEALAVRTLAAELEGEDLELSISSETNFEEAIDRTLGEIKAAETLAAACRTRAKEIETRAAILNHRAERLREKLTGAMQIAGRKTMRLVEGTVTVADGSPKLVILEQDRIPDVYWCTKAERVLDRASLLADLKSGRDIAGVTLDNVRPRLTVRTK